MSKTGGEKKKREKEKKKKKRKCVAKKNVRIFFTSKLPVANKFHKFSSASRYRGRNEVWEEGSWFSMMFSAFVRRASFSWNIKMDDEEKKGGGSNGSDYVKIHRQLKNDEQWFILSIYSNPLFPLMKREYFNVNLFISSTTPVAFFWGWIYVNMETCLKNIVVMIFDRLCLKYS